MSVEIRCVKCEKLLFRFKRGKSGKTPAGLCDKCKPQFDVAVSAFRSGFRTSNFDGVVMQAAYDVRGNIANGRIDMRPGIGKGV
jgi:hypothetical protein